jgi:hypothetical protein
MLPSFDSCMAVISAMICALRLPPAVRVAPRIRCTLSTWAGISVEVLAPPVL